MNDEGYMRLALVEAQKAFVLGEVPIGAIIVMDGEVVAVGHNMRETWNDATAHAEVVAIKAACEKLNRWRLSGATLYVTIEPCPMCAGALVMSRVDRVVYGSTDAKAGAVESIFNIVNHQALNHRLEVTSGVLEDECRNLMKKFFKERRQLKKLQVNQDKA
ncbi:tRNA adenosine(34) deaminase TadA [Anaerosinus gibii]|uniref:tRNA-specific adenosine deaminase n=1 Tax=Selenobaculum gibii TaxID=3054208 RepID=A0A9Y2ETT6_9FIRM|nr:tRNA adenosine(34) deaminase TadA [Selenobaculum gbiensis]WIW70445.1 tRNA adenosine(34) deaminase TadA [Selenobaculum gbiensis]